MDSQDRDRKRRMWGVTSVERPADPEVLKRRPYHEALAKRLARYSYALHAAFVCIGFFIVLLPVLSPSWRLLVENNPLPFSIFYCFSTLSGWALVYLLVLMSLTVILNLRVADYPGGWNPTKQWGFPGIRVIVDLELYPVTKREEFVFFANLLFAFLGTAIWLILPFGLFAYFLRIGG